MATARDTHERLNRLLGYKVSEGALSAREATLATIKRLQVILEQLEDPKVYRELVVGTDENPVRFQSLDQLRKRVQEEGLLDLQILIDPKNKVLGNIPKTVPKDS
jgi:hypothetical protein